MNTDRYPRTMNEAFHKTAEYGAAIERPYRSTVGWRGTAIVLILLAIVLGSLVGCTPHPSTPTEREAFPVGTKIIEGNWYDVSPTHVIPVVMDDGTRCVVAQSQGKTALSCSFSGAAK